MNADEILAFIRELRTDSAAQLESATKQNDRTKLRGRIDALDDILLEVKIQARVAARVAELMAAQTK